jgi:hypothetical protein
MALARDPQFFSPIPNPHRRRWSSR